MSTEYLYEYVYWRNNQPTLKKTYMTQERAHLLNKILEDAEKVGEFWAMTEASLKEKEKRNNKNNKR